MTSAPIRVLLVEDNPGDIRLLEEALREAGAPGLIELLQAQRLSDAVQRLAQGRPDEAIDIVLLDLTLPDASGLDTLQRTHAAAPDVPIVVLTGLNDEALAIRAVQQGAQDYLVKGAVDGNLLLRAMRYAIERKRSAENARRLVREQAARAQAEAAERQYRFLAEASSLLGSSLDYEATLQGVARLCVPLLADFCTIDVLDEEGRLHRVAAAPEPPPAAATPAQGSAPLPDGPPAPPPATPPLSLPEDHPIMAALRTGGPVMQELPEGQGMLVLPLRARDRILGTMSFRGASRAGSQTLAGELAYRTAVAVDNTRLYREAQQAAGARDQVIAVVSHDLRNPLTVISMVAEHLSREAEMPAEQRAKYIDQIQRSAIRMNRLIQDILDVTRLEAGRLALDRQRHEVAPLCAEALDLVRPLAVQKNITLDGPMDAPEAIPAGLGVVADRERVLQVFSNLLGNAVKFTPKGGRIQVRVDQLGKDVRFCVNDSGPGIKQEDLSRIFDRFWQARRTTRQGTGLGLAIAKGIVEAHGGQIWVKSKLDHGSTFFFTLPAA